MDLYYLAFLLFPIGALILYLGFSAVAALILRGRGRTERLGPDRREEAAPPAPGRWATWFGVGGRIVAMGAVLGLEAGAFQRPAQGWFWTTLAVVAALYVLLALVVAGVQALVRRSRGGGGVVAQLSATNAVMAPAAIAGLAAIAAQTTVTVTADHTAHGYDWLPVSIAIPLVVLVVAAIAVALIRARDGRGVHAVERTVVAVVGGGAALLLLRARIPGAFGPMDMFHEGEGLVAATLSAGGAFPWRDLLSVHGIFQDTAAPLVGMSLFGDSRWAAVAGEWLVLLPLSYVSLYVFGVRLFRGSWPFLVAFGVVLAAGFWVPPFFRFMFWPLVLVLLSLVLDRGSWWLSFLLGVALVAQTVFVPEAAYCIPAAGVAVLLRDVCARAARGLGRRFARTLWTVAGGVAGLAVLAAVLVANHALQSFVFYFLIFAPGHELTGGVPVPTVPLDTVVVALIVVPLIALALSLCYFAFHLVERRGLDEVGWVVVAAAVMTALYYTKFLARSDGGHLDESYWVSVPLVGLVAFVLCRRLDLTLGQVARAVGRLRATPPVKLVAVALLVAALIPFPASLLDRVQSTPQRYRTTVAAEPSQGRLGYGQRALDQATYEDLRTVLRTYLGPNDWLFDFSNAPGLYYYLLGEVPHTRYYHVSLAIARAAQADLIGELKRDAPKLVVFTNDRYGLPYWDLIPNPVRHYDVSQYILDHYRPLLSVRGQVLYVRDGATVPPPQSLNASLREPLIADGVAFQTGICSWGYAPSFLSTSPGGSAATTVPTAAATPVGGVVSGWIDAPSTGRQVILTTLLIDGRPYASQVPAFPRADRADMLDPPSLSAKSIRFTVPSSLLSPPHRLAVLAVGADGTASPVPFAGQAGARAATPPPRVTMPSGATVRVSGTALGQVESVVAHTGALELTPPPGRTWTDYRWIEVDARPGFRADTFTLSDRLAPDPGRAITFQTLTTSPDRYRVQVGSCAQWHAYGSAPLFLTFAARQQITAIRLYP